MKKLLVFLSLFIVVCGSTGEDIVKEENPSSQPLDTSTTTSLNLVTTTTNFCESFQSQEEKQKCYNDELIKETTVVGVDLTSACQDMKDYLSLVWMYDYYLSGVNSIELKALELVNSINHDPYNFGLTTNDDDLANELFEIQSNFKSGYFGDGDNPINSTYKNGLWNPDFFDLGDERNASYPDFEKGIFRGLRDLRIIYFNEKEIMDNYSILNASDGVTISVGVPRSFGISELTLRFTTSILNEYLDIYLDDNPDTSHINSLSENYLTLKNEYFENFNNLENYDCNSLIDYAP